MKIKNKIATLLVGLVLLAACSDDFTSPTYTVGAADNAIVLRAGISEGGAGVMTRAGAEDHHANHVAFADATKLRLKVDGTWLQHDPAEVTKTTIGTIGNIVENTDNKHRQVSLTPQLYWDDYGSADPNNMSTEKGGNVSDGTDGRTKGLSIYGVAVDGETTLPETPTNLGANDLNWTALSWNVGDASTGTVDQSEVTNYWKKHDLLISNNVKDGGIDGTYKFDDRASGKLLEFSHAMSKITVRLIASDGFPTTGDGLIGNTTNKFQTAPEVILTSNEGTATTNTEWPYTSGNIDVTTGVASNQAGSAKVKMHAQATPANTYTAIFDALVMPGSTFSADDAVIARIKADNNIYYVTAKKIREAITTKYGSGNELDFKTQPGLNYILTVNVKKTKIEVTATIVDWIDVLSETVSPVINVYASYGSTSGTALSKESFSFYRSIAYDNGYSNGYTNNANGYFAAEATVTKADTKWTFSTPLYWTDHNTHYQMRGVWPLTTTAVLADDGKPRVETSGGYQVIKVKNVAYAAATFPSDLAIGRPNVATDATCNNSDHTAKNLYSDGICATEGTINLEFEYMMSKVEVNLSTTDGRDKVELEGAEVEITNLYTAGDIKLGDRGAIVTGSTSTYGMHITSTANKFMDAIVPQTLTYTTAGAESNVRFKITITNKDAVLYTAEDPEVIAGTKQPGDVKIPATKDVYYADVEPIKKKDVTPTEKVAPDGKWKSGKHYVYDLLLSKTKIDVIAHFKDWITVEASEKVWF